jgi:hypothetical protein
LKVDGVLAATPLRLSRRSSKDALTNESAKLSKEATFIKFFGPMSRGPVARGLLYSDAPLDSAAEATNWPSATFQRC